MGTVAPRSFQKVVDSKGATVSYSECRRQAKRERAEYIRNIQAAHRERSCDLKDMTARVSSKVEDRLSQETLQAEEEWMRFSQKIRETELEDAEEHRKHMASLINGAEPRVVDKLAGNIQSFRTRCKEEREESLMHEAMQRWLREKSLEELTVNAPPRVMDELSDATKDVRHRLGELRGRMRAHDAKVFALQGKSVEELRDSAAVRVDSWRSPQVGQIQDLMHKIGEEGRKTRSKAMTAYSQELRSIVDNKQAAVDCYVDDEVKASSVNSRPQVLAIEGEQRSQMLPKEQDTDPDSNEQVAMLMELMEAARPGWTERKVSPRSKEEPRKGAVSVQRLQSAPWWITDRGSRSTGVLAQAPGPATSRVHRQASAPFASSSTSSCLAASRSLATDNAPQAVSDYLEYLRTKAGLSTPATPPAPTPTSIPGNSLLDDSVHFFRTEQQQVTPSSLSKAFAGTCTPPTSVGSTHPESPWRTSQASATPRSPQSSVVPLSGQETPRTLLTPSNSALVAPASGVHTPMSPSAPFMRQTWPPGATGLASGAGTPRGSVTCEPALQRGDGNGLGSATVLAGSGWSDAQAPVGGRPATSGPAHVMVGRLDMSGYPHQHVVFPAQPSLLQTHSLQTRASQPVPMHQSRFIQLQPAANYCSAQFRAL